MHKEYQSLSPQKDSLSLAFLKSNMTIHNNSNYFVLCALRKNTQTVQSLYKSFKNDSIILRKCNSVLTKKVFKGKPTLESYWWVLTGLRQVFAPFSQDLDVSAHRGPTAFKTNSRGEEYFWNTSFHFLLCPNKSISLLVILRISSSLWGWSVTTENQMWISRQRKFILQRSRNDTNVLSP